MEIKQKSLKLNILMNAILTMSQFIFPLITFPYVSRILLPVGTGKVSFATSIIQYFAMFAQLGIPTYGIYACAKVRDDRRALTKTAQEIFLINLVMSLLAYAAFFVILYRTPKMLDDKVLFLIVSTTIAFNAIGMEWLYKALEQYSYITVRSIIFKFVALIGMFAFVHKQSDYVIYGAISIFAASASNILNFINVHKYIDLKPIGDYDFMRHMKAVGVFFAMSCATTVYTNLDTVMLGFMIGDEEVGYYNAAVKIKGILVSVVTSLGAVILPRASYYIEHNEKEAFLRIIRKALDFVIVVAFPVMIYFTLFAREGILFLSGSAFLGSVVPMQIIMPTILLIGITNVMGIQMLIPMGKEVIVLYSAIAGASLDFVINLLLIPSYGSAGAAFGTLMAEFAVLVVQYIYLKETVGPMLKEIRFGLILFASAIALAASFWVKLLQLGSFITLLLSAICFFGVYAVLLLVRKEPLMIYIVDSLKNKLKKNR